MEVENKISGSMTALITPFKNGKLDLESYEALIKRQITQGIDAIVPVGTTGESATLSHNEHKECIEVAVQVAESYRRSADSGEQKAECGETESLKNVESLATKDYNDRDPLRSSGTLGGQGVKTPLSQNGGFASIANLNKKVKVLAGAGSNSTKEAIELAKFAESCGADGILCVTPYYNKPTQEGLYQHYKAVAGAVAIPLMLYNVPGRTGVVLENSTILRLFSDVKNIYGVKEASGNIEKVIELNTKDSSLCVVSGDDAINYAVLACGGSGVISVTSNLLPNKISALVNLCKSGDFVAAKALNNELYEINKALFIESNPIPIKAAMYLNGILKSLEYRLPLTPPSSENLKKLEKILSKYEVIK